MGIQTCNVRSYGSGGAGGIRAHSLGHSRPETAKARAGVPAVVVLQESASPEKAIQDALEARPSKRGPKPKSTTGWVLGGLDSWAAQAAAGRRPAETAREAREWAADALAWWKRRFPHSVVLAAALHLDEALPHMHVVAVMRDSRGRVGMKAAQPEAAGRAGYTPGGKIVRYALREAAKMMTAIHDSYHEEVGLKYGMERGENRGRGRRGEPRRPRGKIGRAHRAQAGRARGSKAERKAAAAERKRVQRLRKAAAAERERAKLAREEARAARSEANRVLREARAIAEDTAAALGRALRAGTREQAAFIVSAACERLRRERGPAGEARRD